MIQEQVANGLLDIGAIKLSPRAPFTWTSGIKSPIYCDNRKIISHPSLRNIVIEGLISLIRQNYPETEVIAGTATAGIPHAAFISDRMNLPMIYVRSEPKKHGLKNVIEGELVPGKKVVLIEDLISTGGSSLTAIDNVEESLGKVIGVVAIFSYGFPTAHQKFADRKIPLHTLTNFNALFSAALKKKLIQAEDEIIIMGWRENPQGFYEQNPC